MTEELQDKAKRIHSPDPADQPDRSAGAEEQTGMMQILHDAFPDRADEQVLGIGLLYAGVRWGRDFSAAHIPRKADGHPVFDEHSENDMVEYDLWLADYLLSVDATPNQEQEGLCKWVEKMEPAEAVMMLGMNAALYDMEVGTIEEVLEYPEYFDVRLSDLGDQETISRVQSELDQRAIYCPDSKLVDLGYRKPLAIALCKVADREERLQLLRDFYSYYSIYIHK
jgi:hypothetical protein